jgi:aminopeptidase N
MKALFTFCIILLSVIKLYAAVDCRPNKYRLNYDIQHYDIAISIDTSRDFINGAVAIKATCLKNPKIPFQIDLQEPLIISDITYEGKSIPFKKVKESYLVQIPNLITEQTFTIRVAYSGRPKTAVKAPWDGGLISTKDAQGKKWLAMSCQGKGASIWFPCKDVNEDEPDQGVDLHYRIPNGLVAIGNGTLQGMESDNFGYTTWHWKVRSTINPYNITFYIGNYIKGNLPITSINGALHSEYYALGENYNKAKTHFQMVPEMMEIFEDWFGPYPFFNDGFKLVEAPYLGMEHQSAIAYGNNYQMGYGGKDRSGSGVELGFDFIIVHETAHEWFGNSISTRDPAYFWIHEGLASYAEVIYIESVFGKEKALEYLFGTRRLIKNSEPLEQATGKCHNANADNYAKGAQVVHTIRTLLDDDAKFKQLMRKMNDTFYHQVVTGPQMETFISKYTGLNLEQVFNQYLRQKEIPQLAIKKTADGFSYKWLNCIKDFTMPVALKIDGKKIWLQPTTKDQSHIQSDIKEIEVVPDFYIRFILE